MATFQFGLRYCSYEFDAIVESVGVRLRMRSSLQAMTYLSIINCL
jgi:hypothetical protein